MPSRDYDQQAYLVSEIERSGLTKEEVLAAVEVALPDPVPPSPRPVSVRQRSQKLAKVVRSHTVNGWNVVSRTATSAQLETENVKSIALPWTLRVRSDVAATYATS